MTVDERAKYVHAWTRYCWTFGGFRDPHQAMCKRLRQQSEPPRRDYDE